MFSFNESPGKTEILFNGDPVLQFVQEQLILRSFIVQNLKLRPGGPVELTVAGVVVNFAYAFVYAIVGGFVMAWIARTRIMAHLAWLLGLMVLFGVVSWYMYRGLLPWWYEPLVVILGVAGYYLGARLYLNRRAGSPEPGRSGGVDA